MSEAGQREGYAISSLDEMGEGYGFRKIRHEVGVTAFGINALVLPPDVDSRYHYHEEQEETYFVHQGEVEFRFGDGTKHRVRAGGVVRVDAPTHRGMRNVGEGDAIIVIVGGKGGYVGRDGRPGEGSGSEGRSGA